MAARLKRQTDHEFGGLTLTSEDFEHDQRFLQTPRGEGSEPQTPMDGTAQPLRSYRPRPSNRSGIERLDLLRQRPA